MAEALERVIDDPIRELSVSIDQDTWPGMPAGDRDRAQHRHLRRLDIDPPRSLRRRPYVAPDAGIDERHPMGSSHPASHGSTRGCCGPGRTLTAVGSRDGRTSVSSRSSSGSGFRVTSTRIGTRDVDGIARTLRAASLRQLIDKGASVKCGCTRRGAAIQREWIPRDRPAPAATDPAETR